MLTSFAKLVELEKRAMKARRVPSALHFGRMLCATSALREPLWGEKARPGERLMYGAMRSVA